MDIKSFEEYLRQSNMAENTISAYLYAIKEFYSRHKDLNKKNLLIYKTYLIEKFKPKTVNLRIQAMNKYLDCMGKSRLRLKSVKVQQRSYLENVISNADYVFLKNKLKKEENQEWYFVVVAVLVDLFGNLEFAVCEVAGIFQAGEGLFEVVGLGQAVGNLVEDGV